MFRIKKNKSYKQVSASANNISGPDNSGTNLKLRDLLNSGIALIATGELALNLPKKPKELSIDDFIIEKPKLLPPPPKKTEESQGNVHSFSGRVKIYGSLGGMVIEKIYEEGGYINPEFSEESQKESISHEEEPLTMQRPQDLLHSWSKFAEFEIGIQNLIHNELKNTAGLIEDGMQNITGNFKVLADISQLQSEQIARISEITTSLIIDGSNHSLAGSLALISSAFDDASNKNLHISQDAAALIYSLKEAKINLAATDNIISKINKIAKQTNLLALNALIESQKAGAEGKGCKLVAEDAKNLSSEIEEMALELSQNLNAAQESVAISFAKSSEIATFYPAENIPLKDKVNAIINSILSQNQATKEIILRHTDNQKKIYSTLSKLTMDMQSFDSTSQYINNFVNVLTTLMKKTTYYKKIAVMSLGIKTSNSDIEKPLLNKILSGFSLANLKKTFIAHLVQEGYIENSEYSAPEAPGQPTEINSKSNEIELF